MEPKKADPQTEAEFARLISLAEETLRNAPEVAQAIAFQTRLGNTHTALTVGDDYDRTAEEIALRLAEEKDTAIACMVTMWQGGCLDVPSHALRSRLAALDKANADMQILLQGEGCLVIKTIGTILPMGQN